MAEQNNAEQNNAEQNNTVQTAEEQKKVYSRQQERRELDNYRQTKIERIDACVTVPTVPTAQPSTSVWVRAC